MAAHRSEFKRSHTNICVIESRWWKASTASVRPVFELLSDLHTGSSNNFEYEMANSRAGFREVLSRQLENEEIAYVSIATHGHDQGLELFNDEGISRAILRNIFKKTGQHRNCNGLHLGCCSFLSDELAEFMYGADISPWWIAGYGNKVSWIESTSLDLMFFNKLLNVDRVLERDQIKTISKVAKRLKSECGGLIEELDFKIYCCDVDGNVEQLL